MKNKTRYVYLIFFIILLNCNSSEGESKSINNIFYLTAKQKINILSIKSISDLSSKQHFILGSAYKKEKNYSKALLHFANSCFYSKRIKKLSPYPYPVYNFITKFGFKSDYYHDAVYEIANIFYYYRESKYVCKFIDLINDDNEYLYKDALLLKSKALIHLKKHQAALDLLKNLESTLKKGSYKIILKIRIASIYEKFNKNDLAIKNYLEVLKLGAQDWQAAIAARQIYSLGKKAAITIPETILVCEGLYQGKKYNEILSLLNKNKFFKYPKQKGVKLYLKSLIRLKKYKDADKLIKEYKNNLKKHLQLQILKGDAFWYSRNRYRASKIYYQQLKFLDNPLYKKQLYNLCVYRYEANEMSARPLLSKYIELYPNDKKSEFFLWLMGKSLLERKIFTKAKKILHKMLKNYPQGKYSGNARFWCYKINKKNGNTKRAAYFFKKLILYNPGSTYTWILADRLIRHYSIKQLREQFQNAIIVKNKEKALIAHFLLYLKEKHSEKKQQRISLLNKAEMNEYFTLNKNLISPEFSEPFDKTASLLNKYFAAGYTKGINRTLKIFQKEQFKTTQIEKNIMLYYYGQKYNHLSLSINGILQSLDELNLPENISLMDDKIVKQLIPLGFKTIVQKYSKKYNFNQYKIYSVIKAESNFNHNAVSPARATGLMQLMPFTSRDIARNLKIKIYNLKTPETSIQFGTYYLAWLNKFFKGNFRKIIGGYNAGAGNIKKWEKKYSLKDVDLFVETIPFEETRFYILRIEKFLKQYQTIYK